MRKGRSEIGVILNVVLKDSISKRFIYMLRRLTGLIDESNLLFSFNKAYL